MRRSSLLRLVCVTAFAIALTAGLIASVTQTSSGQAAPSTGGIKLTPSPTRTKTPDNRTPVATPTPPAPAPKYELGLMTVECTAAHTHGVRAIFLWHSLRSGPQWIDLSVYNDGFAPGRFVASEPLAQDRYAYVWDGLMQGITHFARVHTLTPSGWQATETFAFYTPVCNAASHEPAPGADMLALQSRLSAAVEASGFNAAIAITDLQTGETIHVNGDGFRFPGCTINLFALIRVAVDLQFGRYPEPEPGGLIEETINRSDPITARRLMRNWIGAGDLFAGINEVNDMMFALGMNQTLMDHPPAFLSETLYGVSNRTTALDMNRGLRALWDARILNEGWRDYMLQKMTKVKPGLNYLIPAGAGYDATVSHKNGFLWESGWADNDIGIVWFERGGRRYGYAISFFTQYVPTKYADIPLGQNVSSQAWQWFVGRYGYP